MMSFIFTGFSPNTRRTDAWLAFKLLFTWQWQNYFGVSTKKLEQWFREYFTVAHAVTFDSGRSALEKALHVAGVTSGDEVIVQAFTCIVVSNAITHLSAVPIYADCTDEYTLNPTEVGKKINTKTKAIIIQHTFGNPAQMYELLAIAKAHNLIVIEDCAHSLGGEYNGKLLGTFGDLAMFSFGSDKVVSGVRGGMVITNNKEYGEQLRTIQTQLPTLSFITQLQHLLHPIFFWIGKNTYHFFIGKIILFFGQKLHLINRIIYRTEKQGRVSNWFPAQLPNAFAALALFQIKNLDTWNKIRQANATFYVEQLMNKKSIQVNGNPRMWLRFPIQVSDPITFKKTARANNIILGDWYSTPIAPADSSASAAQYESGSCPNAEKIGQHILNLPTGPFLTDTDRDRVIALF